MLKNIVVKSLKLIGGLLLFIALLLFAAFVSGSVMDYCLNKDMDVSTAYLFGISSLILVVGLLGGVGHIVYSELHNRKCDVKGKSY